MAGVVGLDVGWSFAVAAFGSVLLGWLAFRVWDGWDLGERFSGWARRSRSR